MHVSQQAAVVMQCSNPIFLLMGSLGVLRVEKEFRVMIFLEKKTS